MSVVEPPGPGHEASDREANDPLLGRLIGGRYRITGILGTGGVGVVYHAIHEELGRWVAIKVLGAAWASDEGAIERFQQEARTSSQIGHPNIVDVYDLGRLEDGRPYLAMERLFGESLAEKLEREVLIPPAKVGPWIREIASALDAVHAHGIVHRDIKPENLIAVARDDGSETIKLLDFGLAAFAIPSKDHRRLTRQGQLHGTPHYMAPECGEAELPDHRADVYSLAVVAYELLSGVTPFDSPNPLHILTQKMQSDAPTMGDRTGLRFPDELEDVLQKGLARDPTNRFESAGAFAWVLSQVIHRSAEPLPAAGRIPTTMPPPPPAPPTRASVEPTSAPRTDRAMRFGPTSDDPDATLKLRLPDVDEHPTPMALPTRRGPWKLVASLIVATGLGVGSFIVASSEPDQEPHQVIAVPPAMPAPERQWPPPPPTQASTAARPTPDEERIEVEPKPTPPARRRKVRARRRVRKAPRPARATAAKGHEAPETPETPKAVVEQERAPKAIDAGELTRLGTAALVQGRLTDAVGHFVAATRANPRQAAAWRGLGLARERLGHRAAAVQAYRQYLQLAPDAPAAPMVRERLDELGHGAR